MTRYFGLGLLGLATFIAACSGSDGGTGTTMPSDGGATGGSSGTGGAAGATGGGGAGGMGTECRTTADCPQTNCYMCPTAVCDNGRCVTSSGSGGAGGATGTGGSAGSAGAGGAGTISCGTQTCGPSQACVTPCCGGAPGFQCTPPPPYCIDIPPSCQGQSLTNCLTLNSCYSPRASGRDIWCTCA